VLVFGGWDSTGPRGGLGTKIQRALVSEIVAVDAVTGVKTSSRIDPAGIQSNVDVYHHADPDQDYTIDPEKAQKKGGKPISFVRSTGEGKGKPSAINHSNVTPSIDELAGGVTCAYIQQTTVLSLPALRRLRFPFDVAGEPLDGERRAEAEHAARVCVAALGLAAMALLREEGYDLRSRCMLVPEGPSSVEAVSSDGGDPVFHALSVDSALELLEAAHARAQDLGFGWEREPMKLVPSKKLGDLIAKSQELAAKGEEADG
jgi:CRISPR-associated protein Csb1